MTGINGRAGSIAFPMVCARARMHEQACTGTRRLVSANTGAAIQLRP